jgi:hypothetical protein
MIRFWTFVTGLVLIGLMAKSMAPGGIDLTEFRVLLALIGLLALAQVAEVVGGWIEQVYADRRDLREVMAEADRRDFDVETKGGSVLAEQASPITGTLAEVHRGSEAFLNTLTGGTHPDRPTTPEDCK